MVDLHSHVISRRDAALLPALGALAIFAAWAADGGGYRTTSWYPGGLFLLGLLVVSVLATRDLIRVPAPLLAPIGLLAAFTAWSYLSVTWSEVPAVAWDGANRTALYLGVFGLFALLPWRTVGGGLWLVLFVVAVATVAVVDFVAAVRTAHPLTDFIGGRYTGPVEYPNGSAGLYLMAAWPALVLAAQRMVPWPVRALLAAAAGFLVELALLTESRGAVFATLATSLVFLVLVPTRVRALLTAILVALCVLPAGDPILDVYRVVTAHGDAHIALVRAGRAMLWSTLALFGVALVAAFADKRWSPAAAVARPLRRATGAVLILLAAIVIAVVGAKTDPVARAQHAWHQFTGIPKPYGVGLNPNSHFAANPLSGNRYDVWRVAWHQFRRHPVEGAGADNFAVDYLRERRSEEEPTSPFSIELRTLGQTGLIGALLLGGFLASCALVLLRRRRPLAERAVVVAAALVATQWLAHGSVDFFWEIPGLAAPAFAALALMTRVSAAPDGDGRRVTGRARRVSGLPTAAAIVVLAVATAASFLFPWLAAADVRAAESTWHQAPSAAASKLARARSLNPLSDNADVAAGLIASRQKHWAEMRSAFRRALRRNDVNWYSWFELAVVDAYTHRPAAALSELRRVKELNPKEWTVGFVRYRLGIGRPVAPRVLDRIFLIRHLGQIASAPPRRR